MPLSSLLDGNRARHVGRKGEKPEENDHFLTQDVRLLDPLLVSSGDRSSDCVNRTHKKMPCYCVTECVWYARRKCFFLVWDVDELESIGLTHQDQDAIIFALKYYLPVRWIVGNPKAFLRREAPTAASFEELDVNLNLSLSDVFSICVAADDHSRDSWDRSSDDPRVRAHMINFIYTVARQHHQVFAELYNRYTLLVTVPLCQRVVASF